ncbi:2,4-dienoyl-CoA reductase-like NADH-dependent reductase (Old Yellow Enzyme family) [Nitrospirillum viridazoti]|uniref:NADH:flavin oxidoreductase n=1 Tax=Nitrospirillum viridazoti TaxID=3144925 RepID=UPI0011A66C78|nr:NADH:flavin oxidoreductase [Nitrospirillum amazonense]TWB44789.1 2,4-dienoyl-CoA reductase-like NADH-dependent reductase (Old Yellow Enzyme family) [Nitrospirillum amazonense]
MDTATPAPAANPGATPVTIPAARPATGTHSVNAAVAPLFQPFAFGRHTLANRLVMAPMTRSKSPGGVPTEDVVAYYRRRVQGGVGLLITEGTTINHPAANGYPQVPAFHGEAALAGWKRVVDAVHAEGGRIIPQLWHVGIARRPGVEPDPSVPGYGPSAIVADGVEVVRAMTQADIDAVVAAFAQAAADAERLGFDGAELHGAHGYIIDDFFWEQTNQRTDAYGGSLENRTRFALEIVRAVRAAVSPDFPIVFRFSQWKGVDYNARIAQTPEELGRILKPLAEAGVDVFHVSTRRYWEPAFDGSPDTLAAWTKRLTGKPVIAVGSVGLDGAFKVGMFASRDAFEVKPTDVDQAAQALARGDFDLLGVGRVLLSDPDWAIKVRDGRVGEVIPFDRAALDRLVV